MDKLVLPGAERRVVQLNRDLLIAALSNVKRFCIRTRVRISSVCYGVEHKGLSCDEVAGLGTKCASGVKQCCCEDFQRILVLFLPLPFHSKEKKDQVHNIGNLIVLKIGKTPRTALLYCKETCSSLTPLFHAALLSWRITRKVVRIDCITNELLKNTITFFPYCHLIVNIF